MEHEGFVDEIVARYAGGRERLFILHGNVNDLFADENDGALRSLPDHLFSAITKGEKTSKIWMHFSVDRGVKWLNPDAKGLNRLSALQGALPPEVSKEPITVMRMLRDSCLRPEVEGGLVIPLRAVFTDAQHIWPQTSGSFMSSQARELLVMLKRFAAEPFYDESNTLIILIASSLSEIHRELREVAVSIEILLPDGDQIGGVLQSSLERRYAQYDKADLPNMRELSEGLTTRQVQNIVSEAKTAGLKLTPDIITKRRRELVRRTQGEFLRFQKPRWTLDDAGGSETAVEAMRTIAEQLRSGDMDVPAGIVFAGQNGVGKSYIGEGLFGSAGIGCVSIEEFKSSEYGGTLRNWGKIETALKSFRRIGVKVDEADARLGQRSGDVHETSKQLLSRQLEFIGDPAYVGRIFWILMTCRPDQLAADFKRPGRCDTIIPLFPIEGEVDGREILEAVMRFMADTRGYEYLMPSGNEMNELYLRLKGMTGGSIKKTLRKARVLAKKDGKSVIQTRHVMQVISKKAGAKVVPIAYELQRLVGIMEALESGNEEMIPSAVWDEYRLDDPKAVMSHRNRISVLRRLIDR